MNGAGRSAVSGGGLGFRICAAPEQRLAPELVAALREVPSAYISDAMSRLCGAVGLTKYDGGGTMVGVAFTVKTRPGDNLMIHKALDLARPGDVLVVDGGGDVTNALVGELMMLQARQRGLAGFVVDGAIRDVAAFRAGGFPCYARGHIHRGPYKDGPGEINVPVTIGGLVISPGDLVLGDDDGLVAFTLQEAPRLLELARAKAQAEERMKIAIAEGRPDRSWVDETLRAKGLDLGARS